MTKEIEYNYDNLNDNDINRVVKRAKVILINDLDEIILCHSYNNYFLLGGHVEKNETDELCLHREVMEEAGINIDFNNLTPFLTIKYLNKDYPEKEVNTMSIANYYFYHSNLKPNYAKINLTEEEKDGGFKIEYVKTDKALEVLNKSLDEASRKGVVLDTIEAVKEYLKREI